MIPPVGSPGKKLRILTWHVHGNYLYSLGHVPHEFVIPVHADGRPGYSLLGSRIPWGPNMVEVAADQLAGETFDCIIYQSRKTYEEDAPHLLTAAQRALPSIFIEHDPPWQSPVHEAHCFRHDRGLTVHVTHYNALAWDTGDMPVRVIEHGVPHNSAVQYTGERPAGITVINDLERRGRLMGADIFDWARQHVPVDLIGMQSDRLGGLGEIANMDVAAFVARYRFFFTPIRYTSLGLALVEAMLCGVPVVGIAATELPTVIHNGQNGFVHTDKQRVLAVMRQLIDEPALAAEWGRAGQQTAQARFGMARFVQDWMRVLQEITA